MSLSILVYPGYPGCHEINDTVIVCRFLYKFSSILQVYGQQDRNSFLLFIIFDSSLHCISLTVRVY